MEIQEVRESESDGCNLRGDRSSDFNSTSDVKDHKASTQVKIKEDYLIPSCLNRRPDELSYLMGFSAKSHYGQEKIAGLPKTSTYWRQQNPSTPGVYVRVSSNYNLHSDGKGMEHHYFEYSKDLQDQREADNFIILVDSFEDENIPPQLGKALPYQYKKCGNSFQAASKLQKHKKVHKAENSYRCPLCGKEFFRAANLRMHKLIHVKERPHKCPICNKGFIRTADVWRHLHSLHKIERSSVVLENENTRNQWYTEKENQDDKWKPKQLSSAVSNHGKEGLKQYPCPICNKAFSKSNLLSKHKVIHRKEKPYKCKECGMAFVQLARLKRHNLTHTGEHPFSCEECNRAFTRLSSLQRHQRIHTGERPSSCPNYTQSFTDSGTLRRHKETHRVLKT